MSNLWEDEKVWLRMTDPGVTQILAISVDPLTENIFYIIPERGAVLTNIINAKNDIIDIGNGELRNREDVAEIVRKEITSTLARLQRNHKPYGPLREENIFLCQGHVLIENLLLVKSSCQSKELDERQEHSKNLDKLRCIIERMLDYRPKYI